VTNQIPSIILVRPQMPENIGMVARAMDNFGFKSLNLVSPREKWPNELALKSSANSKRIIKNTKIYNNLDQALNNFKFVVSTSNRKRFLNKPYVKNFEELLKEISLHKKIAFVFGPENSGLSNNDLMLSDIIFNIQTSKNNKSLNLSHAVLLMAYKWSEFFTYNKNFSSLYPKKIRNIAPKKDFNFFMNFLKKELDEVGFLHPKNKSQSMFNHIQTMFLRNSLSKKELQTLWGMIKKLRDSRKI